MKIVLTICFFTFSGIFKCTFCQSDTCNGINGKNQKINAGEYYSTEFKGEFKCGTLMNGYMIYRDTAHVVFCKLKFKNGKYAGEIDLKTGKKKVYNKGQLSEDGTFDENGNLLNGKKYIYDNNGLLAAIIQFKNGRYVGDGQIE